jgi:tetratricopeptide (TPR) repeat protein
VREEVIAALDEWIDLVTDPRPPSPGPSLDWLKAVLMAAEPDDGWTRQLRAARTEKDRAKGRAALEKLAETADVAKLPVRALTRLAEQLSFVGARVSARQLLRRAQRHYPADFWINHWLAVALQRADQPDLEAAVRYYTAAVALRPETSGVHFNLGLALQARGQLDEAIASFRKALELQPEYAQVHYSLGNVLKDKGQLDEASACFRKAIALAPSYSQAHNNLGVVLVRQGQVDDAPASFRKAIELDPKDVPAHINLGQVLQGKGQLDEASACFRRAIALDPKNAVAHFSLGAALEQKDQPDDAIACYRQAVALNPRLAAAHGYLSKVLLLKGRTAEARSALARALELLPEKDPLRTLMSDGIKICDRLLMLEEQLPRLLRGEGKPSSARDGLDLAMICRHRRLFVAAARFAADALAADAKLADNLVEGYRYHATCSAALAAAGQGEDASKLDPMERTRLRKQALDWLRADLAAWTRQLESGPPADRAAAQKMLRHWQQNPDLAGLRDPVALARLPEEERAALGRLWADVAALLQKAEGPTRKEPQP